VLPAAHEGALNKTTRGLAVFSTIGVLPVTTGFTVNGTILEVLSPLAKSLMTT
jgi:hypothetical protein